MGSIDREYVSDETTRISRLGRPDLSHTKTTPPDLTSAASVPQEAAVVPKAQDFIELSASISLQAVKEVQERLQVVLGVDVGLDRIIARATELSNANLPRLRDRPPSADDLFNQVLGLPPVRSNVVQGTFVPQRVANEPTSQRKAEPARESRILDILADKNHRSREKRPVVLDRSSRESEKPNVADVFSLRIRRGEERRARIFLQRMSTILQSQPERLVLVP